MGNETQACNGRNSPSFVHKILSIKVNNQNQIKFFIYSGSALSSQASSQALHFKTNLFKLVKNPKTNTHLKLSNYENQF